jgi:hypothetical protein
LLERAYPAVEDILKSYSFTRVPAGDRCGTAAENIEDAEKKPAYGQITDRKRFKTDCLSLAN